MKIKKGVPVSNGYAIAQVFLLDEAEIQVKQKYISDHRKTFELVRFEEAVAHLVSDFQHKVSQSSKRLFSEAKIISDAFIQLIQDPHLKSQIKDYVVRDGCSAEYAVVRIFRKYIRTLQASDDDFFLSRVRDLRDIEKRLLRILLQQEEPGSLDRIQEGVIVATSELTVTQALGLDHNKIKGIITDKGGKTSHAAIVAKELGIPAVVAFGDITSEVTAGESVIVDGFEGLVILSPTDEAIQKYQTLQSLHAEYEENLVIELREVPSCTKDGVSFHLLANVEILEEIPKAFALGAEGIGLFRTEFSFKDMEKFPAEHELFDIYKQVLQKAGGREVVARILDLGADKLSLNGFSPKESNPFLGCRGIRLMTRFPDIFKTQIRALLKASEFGQAKMLFPMISTLEEVIQIQALVTVCLQDLAVEGLALKKHVPIGIMLEVPAAVLISDWIAQHVDFMSIGTNDLIQYTVAVDRLNENVAYLYQPAHPAVLRLIKQAVEAAHRAGKPISTCGEIASEPIHAILLLGLGLRELSLAPAAIPLVKKTLCSVTLNEAEEMVQTLLNQSDPSNANHYLESRAKELVPTMSL